MQSLTARAIARTATSLCSGTILRRCYGRQTNRIERAFFEESFSVESTRLSAERGRLTGVDITEAQLDLARDRVPSASFVCADLAKLEFADESFDG